VMRWALIALLAASLFVSAQSRCVVSELYRIGYTLHDPTQRHARMVKWLESEGNLCSKEQLAVIWNNLAEWAGTADSAEFRQRVIDLYKKQ